MNLGEALSKLQGEQRIHLPVPFTTELCFKAFQNDTENKVYVVLTQELEVVTRYGTITVPRGFVSDGASIPKAAQWIIGEPYDFDYLAAAIIHDYLYRNLPGVTKSRPQADLILKDLMWNTGVPTWKVVSFYVAVKSGGWASFKKNKTLWLGQMTDIPKAIPIEEP